MSRLVLDASIAADWLMDDESDPRATAALGRLRRDGAIVPQLWHYEVRNALLVAERRGRMTGTPASARIESLRNLPIITDQKAGLPEAFELARRHRLSFYDALYLELATRQAAPLATLDAALARAALAEGLHIPTA